MKIYSVTLLFLISTISYAQESINWQSWEEAMSQDQGKKYIIDLYTDWCGWCKRMDATTFKDPLITKFINENYVAIKFDGEYKSEITFRDRVFQFVQQGRRGYHTLAAELTNGQLQYPTIVFLDENINLIQMIPGYRTVDELEIILNYFDGDHHKTVSWASYKAKYQNEIIKPRKKTTNNHSKLVSNKGGM